MATRARKRRTIEISWISNRSISINNMQQQRRRWQRHRRVGRRKRTEKRGPENKNISRTRNSSTYRLTHAIRYWHFGNGIDQTKYRYLRVRLWRIYELFCSFVAASIRTMPKWFHFHLLENISFWAPFADTRSWVFIFSLLSIPLKCFVDFQFSIFTPTNPWFCFCCCCFCF